MIRPSLSFSHKYHVSFVAVSLLVEIEMHFVLYVHLDTMLALTASCLTQSLVVFVYSITLLLEQCMLSLTKRIGQDVNVVPL